VTLRHSSLATAAWTLEFPACAGSLPVNSRHPI